MPKHNFKKYIIKKEAHKNHVTRVHSFMLANQIKDHIRQHLHCFVGESVTNQTKDRLENKLFQVIDDIRMQRDQITIGYPKVDIYGANAYVSFTIRSPGLGTTLGTDIIINLNGDI